MAKRKRNNHDTEPTNIQSQKRKVTKPESKAKPSPNSTLNAPASLQIITGSYDRVLHGIIATLPATKAEDQSITQDVVFNDNFLFNAHGSAIRCLALSPLSTSKDTPDSQKIILASGGTDERVNLYHVSTTMPRTLPSRKSFPSTANGKPLLENPKNKEIGTLLHHSSSINVLHFPTRSKLLSGAEDNTISISRSRDWTVLSTIKAPIPRAFGRPSGDTAPPGGTPAGINDFAVHPSMKLMISVGKGEKCMRLWNLVTGKKAGVLNFERSLLQAAGEGKFSSGEGRKVVWNAAGDEFVVGFERGAILFAMDSKPKCKILSSPKSKFHQMRFLSLPSSQEELFTVSTEDGRLLFFQSEVVPDEAKNTDDLINMKLVGELGGKAVGFEERIKDFEILSLPGNPSSFIVVTAGSDGTVRLWTLSEDQLVSAMSRVSGDNSPTLGVLTGSYTTTSRITCLKTFFLRNTESPTEPADEMDGADSSSEFEGLD